MAAPTVSVLILTWNSGVLAREAVVSALAQTHAPLEVLVLDNGSADGGPEALALEFGERAPVIPLGGNLGYTGGYNRGLALARGEVVLLLNPDVRLAATFLERALPAFDDSRVGIVAGLLLRPDGQTVDSSGLFLARSRKPLDRGYGQPLAPARDGAGLVLAACGAAALYRRRMIEDIADDGEFFDRDYFAFTEDLEVGWRAWRAGWRACAAPRAEAVHLRAGGAAAGRGTLAFRRGREVTLCVARNRYLAMLRHDRLGAVLVDLPFILGRDAAFWTLALLKRQGVLGSLWRGRKAFGRAWRQRAVDRRRFGVWGPWRRDVPRRGIWAPAAHEGDWR